LYRLMWIKQVAEGGCILNFSSLIDSNYMLALAVLVEAREGRNLYAREDYLAG